MRENLTTEFHRVSPIITKQPITFMKPGGPKRGNLRGICKLRPKLCVTLRLIIFIFSFFVTPVLYAQDELREDLLDKIGEGSPEKIIESEIYEEQITDNLDSAARQRTEMEIRTSTLSELAVWCRSLGLSEGGTREDLSRRLREHFSLPEPRARNNDSRKLITIESAQITEYFTIGVIDEDYARLYGNVRISLRDGDDIHTINANEILFNRTRNIITARGQVEYEKISDDTTETFRGENITVNLDDWSSIFLDGYSERKLESDGTAYLFSGEVISRNKEEVTVLVDARITSAKNDEALWSINASRLWLLPGSDFAIFNAVLRVGEIPVLYLPFFYFPADELVFHPVVGYRSREGAFIQTTTYLIGQPKSNPAETSSLSRLMGNSDNKEKQLHGLFLRSTGKPRTDLNALNLKLMLDYYVNLGAYIGFELYVPRTGILNPMEFDIGIGISRTITMIGGNYTPYAPDFDGTFDWNRSNLFSISVPFRYRMKFNSSIGMRYGSVSWNLPFYSDPVIDKDFLNRAESMDFLNMIQQGSAADETTLTLSEIGTYHWQVNGNINPSLPFLAPFISRISISNISTTLAFRPIEDNTKSTDNPGRFFYAPDKFTIYSFSGSVSGTPLNIGSAQTQTRPNTTPGREIDDPLRNIGIPISPWTDDDEETQGRIPSTETLVPPVLNQTFSLPRAGNLRFNIDYQITPTSTTELQFRSGYGHWKTYDQVNWGDIQSVLSSFGGNGSLNFRFDHSTGFFSNVVTLSGNSTWRDYLYLNEEAEAFRTPQRPEGDMDPNRVEEARRQLYSQTNYSSSYSYNGTVRPFSENPVFGQSNLQYTFRGTLVRSKKFLDGDGPELTPQWGLWIKEKISEEIYGLNSHQLSTNIAASIMGKNQNITVSAALPPLDSLITTNATFRFWISETNINFRIERPEDAIEWVYKPIYITETLRFSNNFGTLSYYMVINPENDIEVTTIRTSLSIKNFRMEFSAANIAGYEFEFPTPTTPGGWIQVGEPALHPSSISFSYNHSFSNLELFNNNATLSLNISTALKFDLMRHTNSNFEISLGFVMDIPGILKLELSASSANNVIWRYFKGIPGFEYLTRMYEEGRQTNLFLDLLDSFNVFDGDKLRSTGFKMQRFNLAANHSLGDWTATFDVRLFPHLNTNVNPRRYEITADITFLVQWTPISEIKTNIGYDGKLNRWAIK